MTVDGFSDALAQPFGGWSPGFAKHFWGATTQLAKALHVDVCGSERVPAGRALLVMNHAFGFDAAFPIMAIWNATGRRTWVLGEHAWWKFPFIRRLAAAVGTVDGTPQNVDTLLARDELVMVLPGGVREAVKPREMRYRLLWGDHLGFVRAAERSHAPLIPVAAVGADELFEFVGDAIARGRRWTGHDFPIPRPAHGFPWLHRTHLTYLFGEPVPTPADASPEALARCRREVSGAIHELIDAELARRQGLSMSTRFG